MSFSFRRKSKTRSESGDLVVELLNKMANGEIPSHHVVTFSSVKPRRKRRPAGR